MKKVFLRVILFLFPLMCCVGEEAVSSTCKYPKMDIDFRFYQPGIPGYVTGNNGYLKLRSDYSAVEDSFSFMVESRFGFAHVNKFSFAFAFGFNGYGEINVTDENRYTCAGISLGAGMYYHLFDCNSLDLTGPYIFLYPAYNIPFYILNDKTNQPAYDANNYKWKMAADLGYTVSILDIVTLSPYVRTIGGFINNDFKIGIDFGFTVGIYFKDKNYQ